MFRISGPLAGPVLEEMTGARGTPRIARLVSVRLPDGSLLDQGLALWFPGPASFTGEDVAELHLHGSIAVERTLREVLLARGLRPAEAGAFTLRAFEHGKLDLAQAEGLGDLLRAETEGQRRHALGQLGGRLSELAEGWRHALLGALALLTATIDFADEDDVPDGLDDRVVAILDDLIAGLDDALSGVQAAARLRDGVRVVLTGPPNAGKSSLLNALAGSDHAIVSDVPGTTRDVLEARIERSGHLVVLTDTAGIRETDDTVEQLGVARARAAIATADLRLELRPSDQVTAPAPDDGAIHLASKADIRDGDLPQGWTPVSVRSPGGTDALLQALDARLDGSDAGPIIRQRQVEAAEAARSSLRSARDARSAEVAAFEIEAAVSALDALTGRIGTEEVLGAVFAEFCIGK